ncbi:UBX domain-containing protein 1-like [Acyrthosiphon pisum]|uniref:Uncharacterized protein n=1 Tax=Acyrthosiphon pisum TaxID=7029 RepID=A0A8R2FBX2_ACYPI|nr:UBX domain-containing protein 1-like [Acyrthosiphon pisum]|eukprot:XP_008187178.1 PREDICTED: UBX domain-containing protein 1-like [Acyrthosiphon pisum]
MKYKETVQCFIDMGFEKAEVEKCISMSRIQGVEPAAESLLANNDDEMGPSTSQGGSTSNTNSETNTSYATVAKSYGCEECDKLFTDTTALEYHAIKSGHSCNFAGSTEEMKPLTDDDKIEQLKKLEERLKKNREECKAKEKEEELERKKIRIYSVKDKAATKKKLEDEDIKTMMDDIKRVKQEDKVTRDRVKAEIEADKLHVELLYLASEIGPLNCELPEDLKLAYHKQIKDYSKTKLKIRLTNGQIIVETFNVKEIMAGVRVYIELHRSDGDAPFGLMRRFPRKVFTCGDDEKSLEQLGLVPRADLILY